MNTYKGLFFPKNPHKYKGDVNNIVYRSSWERMVMVYMDESDSVVEWSSEEYIIPYICASDGRPHRYYIDFWVKSKTKDGFKEVLIEVKPESQTKPPIPGKRKTARYLNECKTYMKNVSKWNAAKEFARKRGMEFVLVTEKTLGIRKL